MRFWIFTGALLAGLALWQPARAQYAVNGSAQQTSPNCYRLTNAVNFQSGSVWYLNLVDISKPYELYVDIMMGCNDGGADGLAFVLQPISTSIGTAGEGIGYGGVNPSFAVEMDTWQNTNRNDPIYDHMAIMLDGIVDHFTPNNLAGPVPILASGGNAEDCQFHKFRMSWNPDSQLFRVYVDCNLRLSWSGNLVNDVFNGNPLVYWGFTSATGGFNNEHRFCLDYISFTEDLRDTAVCRGNSVQLFVGSGDVFSWSPATGLSSTTIANPIATPQQTTTYVATITDACGQVRRDTVTVVVQDTLQNVLGGPERVCDGQTITLDATTPFSTYLWEDGSTQPQLTVSQAGTYTVQVSNTCAPFVDSILVLGQVYPTFTQQPATCFGSATGFATVSISSDPPYTFTWYNSSGNILQTNTGNQGSSTRLQLAAGTYAVVVQDGNGCVDTVQITISQPPPLAATLVSQVNLVCANVPGGSFTLAGSGGTPPYQYSANGTSFQASPVLTGLTAGTYNATVRDANGCTATVPVTLTAPPLLSVSLVSQVNIDCFGNPAGQVLVSGSGGTGALSYAISGSGFQPQGAFAGLTAGTYTVTVRDANLCTSNLSVTLTQPPPLVLSVAQQQNVDCAGNATGAVVLAGSGGAGAYTYGFTGLPLGSSPVFGGLSAGTYLMVVRDDSACVSQLAVTITEPAPLGGIIVAQTQVDCFGNNSGSVTFSGTGGSAPYQYAFDGGNFGTIASFDSLPAGVYSVIIRDDSGCQVTTQASFVDPPPLTAAITGRQDVDCLGNNTGVMSVAGTGGTLPYSYALNGSVFGPDSAFTSLYAGFYTLTVRDANGCTVSADSIVTTPTGLAAGIDTQVNVACFGGNNGSISLIAQGGTQPYQYTFDSLTYFSTPFVGQLGAQTDTVVLVDANGCIVPVPFTITEPPLLTLAVVELAGVACNGDSSGWIRLEANGGVLPYAFSSNGVDYQVDSLLVGLAAGAYTLSVRDANACITTLDTTVSEPPLLTLSITELQQVDCYGNATGDIRLSASGGAGAYLFQLDSLGFQPDSIFTGLLAGTYTVTVRDDSACTSALVIPITQPDSLILSVSDSTDILCFGAATGELILAAAGGTPGYVFSLDSLTFQPGGGFDQLPAGIYTAWVRDDSGCVARIITDLTEPPRLVLHLDTLIQIPCYGQANGVIAVSASGGAGTYAFSFNGGTPDMVSTFDNLTPGLYDIVLTDANGCRDSLSDLRITEPDSLEVLTPVTDVRCFGGNDGQATALISGGIPPYQVAWGTFPVQTTLTATGLTAGLYTVEIRDLNGCVADNLVFISEPPLLEISPGEVVSAYCNLDNGFASVRATGGVPGYQYRWESLPAERDSVADQVAGGTYLVTLTDANACTDTLTVQVGNVPPAVPDFDVSPDQDTVLASRAQFQFLNTSQGAVMYRWDFGDGRGLSDDTSPVYTYETPGTYTVTLTAWNEFFVCPTDTSRTFVVIPDGAVWIPSGFTPNGDGINDDFLVKGEGLRSFELVLYDRWGREITRFDSLEDSWPGTQPGGSPAPEGVYTWVVRARLNSMAWIERGGTVTLIR
ncbi:MAG: gliding motility-associated C-terminal domain-containing protein [Bacteroidia bacterium]|nr:gliding motility-associated C-terminal domain-containing protein [Bacteroidia bacterium]